ncbi:cysteine synthase family protein [Candidatus Poribacteria bacterium]|nr:cysteine synthase family protein [Candidatus Poribacteria bacterium]
MEDANIDRHAETRGEKTTVSKDAILHSALGMIGNTPLVSLERIHPGPGRLLAKAEFVQPGGSVKDRAALRIIQDAYSAGKLSPGKPVVEMTSGNMGAGLAVVCNVMGNPFVAVMSEGNSPARARMLESLGAEVVLVPQVDGAPGQVTGRDIEKATERAVELAQTRGAFYVDQFNNVSSVLAHEAGTGPEIWEAVGGEIDGFVAAVGSGGAFVGTSRFLKRRKPSVYCAAVEPEGAEILAGKKVTKPKHIIQGIGYGIVPPHWDVSLADTTIAVSDEQAARFRKELANKEGLCVGFSAAANVCASLKLLSSGRLGASPTVVTILCDTGLKY